jgi:D-alanyl-D-alanine carboxypeptidase
VYGMLLESGNDAAEALARGVGAKDGDTGTQSVDRFVGWMNDKVAELGLTDTHFVNPHGLSDPDHYSTPRNLAAFMMYAAQNHAFMTIITSRTYTDSIGVEHTSVNRGPEFITSYIGGKTGYDDATGWCLIEFGQRDDAQLVSVSIDGVAPETWYRDHQILLEYGFAARADRIASGQPISGDVVSFAIAQAVPTDIPVEVAQQDTPAANGSGAQIDTAPKPVHLDGTPVPVAVAKKHDGHAFGNWKPAFLILVLLLILVLVRSGIRPKRTTLSPVALETVTAQTTAAEVPPAEPAEAGADEKSGGSSD